MTRPSKWNVTFTMYTLYQLTFNSRFVSSMHSSDYRNKKDFKTIHRSVDKNDCSRCWINYSFQHNILVWSVAESPEHLAFCQSEYFRHKCDPDEVILMTHARYGRMRISKCVKENFGYVGCSVNVLDIVDSHCSGRRSCSVRVLDDNFENMKPCHDDLKSYLEVNFKCVKG